MELQVKNLSDQAEHRLTVPEQVFDREFNEALIHQIVVAYLAGGRAGTRAQKNRAAVRGGGAKPWRQKGTGRARAGTIRSPLWRGGGVTFAARPQDHSQKVNRKMYRAALCAIFSELLRQDRLLVVDALTLAEPRTRLMTALLAKLGIVDNVLLVSEALDKNVYLAARNLPKVEVCEVAGLDPVSLIRFDKIVITAGAVVRVGEWLA